MLLQEIRLERLQRISVKLKWGSGNFRQERYFYSDEKNVYKFWHRKYVSHRLEVLKGVYSEYKFNNKETQIASIDCGLINNETCPAFVDVLLDEQGFCRGYVMKKGVMVQSEKDVSNDFIGRVWKATLKSGYAHTDLCTSNIIRIDGAFSLIDIDSPPSNIHSSNIEFERASGSLRPHVLPVYRDLLEPYVLTQG